MKDAKRYELRFKQLKPYETRILTGSEAHSLDTDDYREACDVAREREDDIIGVIVHYSEERYELMHVKKFLVVAASIARRDLEDMVNHEELAERCAEYGDVDGFFAALTDARRARHKFDESSQWARDAAIGEIEPPSIPF